MEIERLAHKVNSTLKKALRSAQGDEELRVIMNLYVPEELNEQMKKIQPSQFQSRQAWREALIHLRTEQFALHLKPTIVKMKELPLSVHGGTIQPILVVDGNARNIAL